MILDGLGTFWERLVVVLGTPGGVLEPPWGVLEPLGRVLGGFLGRPGSVLGGSWRVLGTFLDILEASWECPGLLGDV